MWLSEGHTDNELDSLLQEGVSLEVVPSTFGLAALVEGRRFLR